MTEATIARRVRRPGAVRAVGIALILGGLLAAAIATEVARDLRYGEPRIAGDVLYVRSPVIMKKLALSFGDVLADAYWIRAIQYYGGVKRSSASLRRYELLYPFLDITTSLDPRFVIAYRFGAIFLAEPDPGGPGRPDQAIALLQKGLLTTPDRWQYMQDIGFVYYWWVHDYRSAADWFERAGRVKGAPWFLTSLAAVTSAEGGDRRRSRLLWRSLRETSDNDWLRANAELRLVQIDAMDQIDQLQRIVAAFDAKTGRLPGSWEPLVQAGALRSVPLDPTGVAYVLDPGSGSVTVSTRSKLYPLPQEPGHHTRERPDA